MSHTRPNCRPSLADILGSTDPLTGLGDGDEAGALQRMVSATLAGPMPAGLELGAALGGAIGLKCVDHNERRFGAPYESVVRALVTVLRQAGRNIVAAGDAATGATIQAVLPKTIFHARGTLTFDVVDEGASMTVLRATAEVPGQLNDWGAGGRAIRRVLSSIDEQLPRSA